MKKKGYHCPKDMKVNDKIRKPIHQLILILIYTIIVYFICNYSALLIKKITTPEKVPQVRIQKAKRNLVDKKVMQATH